MAFTTLDEPFLRSQGPRTRSVSFNKSSSSTSSLAGLHASTMTKATTATAWPLFAVPLPMSSSSSSPIIEPMVGRMFRSRKTRRLQQYPTDRSKTHAVPLRNFSSSTTTTHTLSPPPPTRTSTRASIRVTSSIEPKPSATTKPKSAAVLVVPAKTTGSEGEKIGRWETWERMAFLRSVRVHGRGNWKAIAEDIPTR